MVWVLLAEGRLGVLHVLGEVGVSPVLSMVSNKAAMEHDSTQPLQEAKDHNAWKYITVRTLPIS